MTFCEGDNIINARAKSEVNKMSPRTGRPKSDNPRNKSLNLRLTQEELDLLQECAEKLNKTRTDTIVLGLYLIKNGQK